MPRNNIILRNRAVPKKVTLPGGRTFYKSYERIRRSNLPPNLRVARRGTIGPHRQKSKEGMEWLITC